MKEPIPREQFNRLLIIDDGPSVFSLLEHQIRKSPKLASYEILRASRDHYLTVLQKTQFNLRPLGAVIIDDLQDSREIGIQIRTLAPGLPLIFWGESAPWDPGDETIFHWPNREDSRLLDQILPLLIKNRHQNLQARAAERADQFKGRFLSQISHEIRTPLNGIIGMTDLLQTTDPNREQEGYLELLKGSAESLLLIVNEVLDYSKIEAGKLTIEKKEFSLTETLDNLIDISAVGAHYKGLAIEHVISPNVPDRLIGDSQRLSQILLNLLNNAVKFTNHGSILLNTEWSLSSDDPTVYLNFSVTDTGIGIPREKEDRLFRPFEQTGKNENQPGTGLGLTISRALSRLMGGDLVYTRIGTGARFTCSLPFLVPEDQPEPDFRKNLEVYLWTSSPILREKVISETLRREIPLKLITRPEVDPSPMRKILFIDTETEDGPTEDEISLLTSYLGPKDQLCALSPRHRQIQNHLNPEFDETLKTPIRADRLDELLGSEPLHPSEPLRPKSQTPEESRHQILIAEDNATNQILLERMLNRLGQTAEIASNGRESLEKWKENPFDLVLMDCSMPEMDGYETTREIRALDSGKEVPIIAITANAFHENREKCLAAGMTDFLSKPFTLDGLRAILEKYLPKD